MPNDLAQRRDALGRSVRWSAELGSAPEEVKQGPWGEPYPPASASVDKRRTRKRLRCSEVPLDHSLGGKKGDVLTPWNNARQKANK